MSDQPKAVINLHRLRQKFIEMGFFDPDCPPVEPLPWGWTMVTYHCMHEFNPRHVCETFSTVVYVREFLVRW